MSDNQGVVGHSTLAAQEEWAIISCNQEPGYLSAMRYYLVGITQNRFKDLNGVFDSVDEISFLIPYACLSQVLMDGWLMDQQCVLVLGKMDRFGIVTGRKARLQYLTGQEDADVGLFVETLIKPDRGTSHTYDPRNGTYFVTVPTPKKARNRALSKFTPAEHFAHLLAYKAGRVSSPTLS